MSSLEDALRAEWPEAFTGSHVVRFRVWFAGVWWRVGRVACGIWLEGGRLKVLTPTGKVEVFERVSDVRIEPHTKAVNQRWLIW